MEKKENKSNYLVQGTILAVASIIARVIGMIYRIPLTNILGDEGNGYYTTANQIYTILLMISTFSLPLAVSKLVSERIHQGQYKNAQKVFRCAMRFSVIAGGVISLLTFFLAGVICGSIMKVDHASYALRVLSPAIFIFAIAGVFRGYFQGHESMVPTAVSQIIEQIVNAFVSVIAAALLFRYGVSVAGDDPSMGPAMGAAGGTSGTVVSVAVALVFLVIVYSVFQKSNRRYLRHDQTKRTESDRAIYTAILATILPVVLSTLIYNITPTLDQSIFNTILAGQGYTKEQYTIIYGIYSGKFYVLMNVPLVLASSLAPSVVPSLSAAMINGDYRDAKVKVRTTMRYTMIITIPCAVGLAALASPIMQLLFRDSHRLPASIMQAGGLMIVLFAISTLSTAVLQGMSRMREPVKHSAIALVIHVLALILFLKRFNLNIYGVVYANTLFAFIVCVLNSMAIKRHLHYRQEIPKTFIIPLISAAFMGIAAMAVYWGVDHLILLAGGSDPSYMLTYIANAIAVLLAVLIAILTYGFFLIRLKGIRESEIETLPKGATLITILRKNQIFIGIQQEVKWLDIRETLKDKSRIIIKIGSSSLTHPQTGALDLTKLEILIREICNIKNMGKDVILVSSGAIAVGSRSAGFQRKPKKLEEKQACAAIGQAQLMMIYQKLFAEYGHMAAQVLMTKNTITNDESRRNAYNTFQELLKLDAIPIVNENDTVSTYEIQFGDNDTLSALVSSLVGADLLILLSDIDGLFTDDPHRNPDAEFIHVVESLNEDLMKMGKGTTSSVGTGGMSTKLSAARIATSSGADMIIANGKDFHIIHKLLLGENLGTLFLGKKDHTFSLEEYLHSINK